MLRLHCRPTSDHDILFFSHKLKQVCRVSLVLQSDRNLRGPHVARQQQLSIDICCRRPTSAAKPPAAAAAVDRRDRRTDGRTLDRLMTLTAIRAFVDEEFGGKYHTRDVADLQELGAGQEGERKRCALHAAQTSPEHPHVRFDFGSELTLS